MSKKKLGPLAAVPDPQPQEGAAQPQMQEVIIDANRILGLISTIILASDSVDVRVAEAVHEEIKSQEMRAALVPGISPQERSMMRHTRQGIEAFILFKRAIAEARQPSPLIAPSGIILPGQGG